MKPVISIRRKLHRLRMMLSLWSYINLPMGDKAFVIGTPSHANIGDSAIAIAEIRFLQNALQRKMPVKEITVREIQKFNKLLQNPQSAKNHYFWHGGGNMGDQWYNEEMIRQRFIMGYRDCRFVIFPQTIFYSDTESGQSKKNDSKAIYNHPDITIVAREKTSFEIMKKVYPEAQHLLTPDIVLSSTMEDYGVINRKREGVLFISRSDPEKAVDEGVWEKIADSVESLGRKVIFSDMISDVPLTKENRMECVRRKMQDICDAELVITDRLHGMVFAALTGTPCIVFSNYSHKVKGTYDWISYLPYICYVESFEEAKRAIPSLLSLQESKYEKKPLQLYFDELSKMINQLEYKSVRS